MNHDHDTFWMAQQLQGTTMKRILATLALALASAFAIAQPVVTQTITTQNLTATAACTAGSCVVVDMTSKGGASVQVTGTYTASGGLSLQRTVDGTTWETISANAFVPVGGTGTATITSAATGTWGLGGCVGFRYCRVTALGAVTGTATLSVFTTNASVGGSTSVSGGAGDASAANQVTGNASLASIDGKLVGGAGAVGSSTLRTTQASDSPLVATLGATADAAATQGSTGTVSAKLREMSASLGTINTSLGTLNTSVNTAANYEATKDAAVPTRLVAMGARIGANEDAVAQGAATAAINVSTATTTQLVALSGTTKIYVTGLTVVAGGTGNITFVYGTGSACGTGTTSLSGAIPLIANAGLSLGSGLGAVLMVPAGQALCITTSAAVQMSGFVTYAQF
jgi:hypothetical protein